MRHIDLFRMEQTDRDGTFGALRIDGTLLCWTLEPQDRNNTKNISCIPVGQYTCQRYSSVKYPDTFEVQGVPDRSHILFHSGNTDDDTTGCILLGETLGKLRTSRAILNSGATFRRFLAEMAQEESFILNIFDYAP